MALSLREMFMVERPNVTLVTLISNIVCVRYSIVIGSAVKRRVPVSHRTLTTVTSWPGTLNVHQQRRFHHRRGLLHMTASGITEVPPDGPQPITDGPQPITDCSNRTWQ